jgi:PPOX class probable F420-dependent enzyme
MKPRARFSTDRTLRCSRRRTPTGPQSSVIFVKRDGDTVVFRTIKGRLKTRNMARDPRVSLLVVGKEKGCYVVFRGSVEITEDPEKRLLYEMYDRYMGGMPPPPEPTQSG